MGKRKNTITLAVITAVEIVLIFFAVTLGVIFLNNSQSVLPKLQNKAKYDELKNYVTVAISPNVDMSEAGSKKLDQQMTAFFKSTVSDSGMLFSLSAMLETATIPFFSYLNEVNSLTLTDYVIYVNNHYLTENPAYAADGKPVRVNENERKFWLLVPEKYQGREKELREYFSKEFTFFYYFTDDIAEMGIAKAQETVHPALPLEIIYIKDDQRFFMYEAEHLNYIHEYISDPIISIVTEGNTSEAAPPNYVSTGKYKLYAGDEASRKKLNDALETSGLAPSVLNTPQAYNTYTQILTKYFTNMAIQFLLFLLCMAALLFLQRRSGRLTKQKSRILLSLLAGGAAYIVFLCLHPGSAFFGGITLLLVMCIGWVPDIRRLLRIRAVRPIETEQLE